MRRQRNRRNRRRDRFGGGEDVNPMSYISNLSDVMLILAVGIMLALILHWNVEIDATQEATETQGKESVSFTEDDLQDMDEMPDDAQKMGNVYYDSRTGKYYYKINE
ncbi:MAG: DUF2149 domain-containing protein [Clostridiales bacterium]|nr:DUF2149 domain-containing protein [Clostridiales bacterium]MDD7034931.1 DUF2149 domain-containing protein [Bacillota bacterium]MDY2920308.1 DUF2149 domain-containing protein [Lentihominibacter sp.]